MIAGPGRAAPTPTHHCQLSTVHCPLSTVHCPLSNPETIMTHPISRYLLRSTALALLLAAGCSNNPSVESFTPPKNTARDALTAALDAWQKGQAQPGAIENATPKVQMNDPQWAKGAKLKSYEIVEELPGDSPRKF